MAAGLQELYDEGIDPDAKIPAYAAMHAYVTLRSARYRADAESVVGRITLEYQSQLNDMARQMMPDELDAAVERSRNLITSNENCCYSIL